MIQAQPNDLPAFALQGLRTIDVAPVLPAAVEIPAEPPTRLEDWVFLNVGDRIIVRHPDGRTFAGLVDVVAGDASVFWLWMDGGGGRTAIHEEDGCRVWVAQNLLGTTSCELENRNEEPKPMLEAAAANPGHKERRPPAREKLLKSDSKLFYADGLAATGIDAVTADAGVAKMSLYNNVASRSDLVTAYLHERHEEWLGLYRRRLEQATDPVDRLLAVFDAYTDHAHFEYQGGFRGCGLLNAAAELQVGDPGREIVKAHKEEVEALLAAHLDEFAPEQAERNALTAKQLSFLLEGAVARAGLEGNDGCLSEARRMAHDLVSAL